MALTKLTADVANISKFDNTPSDDPGYTSKATRAAAIKAQMDKGAVDIKTYINNILTPQLDTLLALAGAYDSADVNAVLAFITQGRKNLLHNWDFRAPVNQRGQSSYTGAGHSINRWIINGGTLTVGETGISLTSAFVMTQLFEVAQPYTLDYVFSYLDAAGQVHSRHISAFETWLEVSDYVNVYLDHNSLLIMSLDTENVISAVKLEIGTVSTLAYDAPADIGEQTMLCKRHYRLWTTEAARTEALKEVGIMRLASPTLGEIVIGGTTYYYADANI